MNTALTYLVVGLNGLANQGAEVLLAPIAVLPGWASATAVAAVTGVLMLLAFKYTSNQSAIKRARNGIKADILALSLFKDSMTVSLRAQGRILLGAVWLFWLALVPMAVMLVPMCLLLAQLALWYQAQPLRVGEAAVVTVKLAEAGGADLPEVQLAPTAAIETLSGPVRVPAKRMVCWNLAASEAGYHRLQFQVGENRFAKELAVGDGFQRVSLRRPAWKWTEVLRHPREAPFPTDAPVQAIEIAYPDRLSWTAGSQSWLWYWFAASMMAAFAARPLLKVNI